MDSIILLFILLVVTSSVTTNDIQQFNCTRLDDAWMQFPGLCRIFEANNFNETKPIKFEPGHIKPDDEYEIIFMRSTPKILPAELFTKIPRLVGLEAQFCSLTKLPDGIFEPARELRKIDLKENSIEEIRKDTFKGLLNLNTIDLYRNKIQNIHHEAFYWLPDLEHVLLGSNQIYSIERYMFSRQTKLKTIDLSGNLISGRFELVVYFVNKLDISYNLIRNVSIEATVGDDFQHDVITEIVAVGNEIKKFNVVGDLAVETINLHNNQLHMMENICVSRPRKVKRLDVGSNLLAMVTRDDLKVFPHLEELNLSNVTLRLGEVNIFHDLSDLVTLDISYNSLNTVNMCLFEHLDHLQELVLDGNNLSELTLSDVHAKSHPFTLSLFNNRFTCDELKRIVKRLIHLNGSLKKKQYLTDNQISSFNGIECYE